MQRNEFCIPVRQVICIDNFFACKLNANNMQWIHFEVLLQKLHCAVPVTLHVLYFHCMFIGIQNSCKLKVRAVQWRSSWFFNGKWRCDAVEAICLPRRSAFFLKKQQVICSVRFDMDLSENCTWLYQLFKKIKRTVC